MQGEIQQLSSKLATLMKEKNALEEKLIEANVRIVSRTTNTPSPLVLPRGRVAGIHPRAMQLELLRERERLPFGVKCSIPMQWLVYKKHAVEGTM